MSKSESKKGRKKKREQKILVNISNARKKKEDSTRGEYAYFRLARSPREGV